MAEPALFTAYPRLRDRLPWVELGLFPTPVERVTGLLPPSVELWVKREDRSGIAYGGNKVRKLEFLLGEARARGERRLVTVGGIGSHHVLATAIYGAQLEFTVEAALFPQPLTEHVREQIRADLGAGAILRSGTLASLPVRAWWARRRARSYFIAGGGSSPVGTLGYVSGGLELKAQIASGELPSPDVVYVALGSCGTAAGLLVGLRGLEIELAAVRVVDRAVANARATRALAAKAIALMGEERPSGAAPRLRIEHECFGGAYGRSTAEALAAVREAAAVGIELEPTYTGKAMAALLADASAGRLDGKRVLFMQTFSSADLQPLLAQTIEIPPSLRRYFPAAA